MSEKTILMADNIPDFLEQRREFLEDAGYMVITANNPRDTEKILERGWVDLAILDLRLEDDDDQEDKSGLMIARKYGQRVPIIILTAFPIWGDVKSALGQDLNGISPVVDFLSKEEGAEVMVRSVNMTLTHPRLKANILQEFHVESSQDLNEKLRKNEPADISDKFQKSLNRTEGELKQRRMELSQQSENHQRTANLVRLAGMVLLLAGALLVYNEMLTVAVFSGVFGVVSEFISRNFIARANQAARQVEKVYEELQKIYRASYLISLSETIEVKSKRESAKMLIIEKLTDKWIA